MKLFHGKWRYALALFSIVITMLPTFRVLAIEPSQGNSSVDAPVEFTTRAGKTIGLYEGSYALLISISDYTAGWPDLDSIPSEMANVENALVKQGFHITNLVNPDAQHLRQGIQDFIANYGFEENNRLLFFFSGHGHTRKDGLKGYLVPADAADPTKDEKAFLAKALGMEQILAWARQIETKHALFLFDSCFSGSVFKSKSAPMPKYISQFTSLPVRQFITAGSAGELVPAESVFAPAFVDAISNGWGDLDKDGYITGTELGLYLQRTVPKFAAQTPQFGKILDYELSRGDFVFVAGSDITETIQSANSDMGELRVETNPPGALISIEGSSQTRGPAPLAVKQLKPGEVTVNVQKEGYLPQSKVVLIRGGKITKIIMMLEPKGSSINVVSSPSGAEWYLDGALAGNTPDQLANVTLGQHKVVIKKPGYEDWETTVVVDKAKPISLNAKLNLVRERYSLVVDADPVDAQVHIKNLRGNYKPGIRLIPGRYFIEVSAPDYLSYSAWIEIGGADKNVSVVLRPRVRRSTAIVIGNVGQVIQDVLPGGVKGPEMVVLPGGRFVMGSNGKHGSYVTDATPRHSVSIGNTIAVGKYEVTFAEYDAFAQATNREMPADEGWGRDDRPVINISWQDAKEYVAWLSEQTGYSYRLLSESEWEYVARGSSVMMYWWGDDMGNASANCMGCGSDAWRVPKTSPVGYFGANLFGVFDTAGNVWEWVEDCYHTSYRGAPANGKAWVEASCDRHVLRGGAWNSQPGQLRASTRGNGAILPFAIGFRIARDL